MNAPVPSPASPVVAIIANGAMGAAVGGVLAANGLRVVTSLEGRSEESRARAEAAGMVDLGSDAALVSEAYIFLSIVPPARAVDLAERIAVVAKKDRPLAYLDCNAIAPQTMRRIAATLAPAGVRLIDGGIVGPPPAPGKKLPRLYVSGPDIAPALALKDFGLDVRPAGEGIGDASALKLCYAALTKGMSGLFIELTAAAASYGVAEVLQAEFEESQKAIFDRLADGMPATFGKAHRFAGEMREIATAFGARGLPPEIYDGLAELYEIVAEARRSNSRMREVAYPDLSARLARVIAPLED